MFVVFKERLLVKLRGIVGRYFIWFICIIFFFFENKYEFEVRIDIFDKLFLLYGIEGNDFIF